MNKIFLWSVALVPLIMAIQLSSVEAPEATHASFHAGITDSAPEATHESFHAGIADRVYEGVDRCRTCHRKEEDGGQYGIWQEGPHSKAYEALASDEAKAFAAERGIDNPQTSNECLQCHVTGYDAAPELLGDKYKITDGVGCESCHGPGGDYYKKNTMISITKGEIDGASVGLVKPDEQVCVGCHNEKSPSYKEFNFEEFSKKIAHPVPEAKMAEYK